MEVGRRTTVALRPAIGRNEVRKVGGQAALEGAKEDKPYIDRTRSAALACFCWQCRASCIRVCVYQGHIVRAGPITARYTFGSCIRIGSRERSFLQKSA